MDISTKKPSAFIFSHLIIQISPFISKSQAKPKNNMKVKLMMAYLQRYTRVTRVHFEWYR